MNLKNITLWKSIFSSRSPQKIRLKNQGARDVILRKSTFLSRSPREISFLISQHRPQLRAARKMFKDAEMFSTMWTYFPPLEMDIFLNIAPRRAQRGIFWNVIEQSFIFRLNVDFHQPRTQYALRTIDHTTLCVNQYSRVVLNKFWRTSARNAEALLTVAPILLTNFVLNQGPIKHLWRSTSDPGRAMFVA